MGPYFQAQILIGESHLYYSGLSPSYRLYYMENEKVSWFLYNDKTFERIRWILGPRPIDLAVVMIALHVVKSDPIIELALRISKNALDSEFWSNREFTSLEMEQLFSLCKDVKNWPKLPKLIITIFQDNFLIQELNQIKNYPLKEIVFCLPTYVKDDRTPVPWMEKYLLNNNISE